VAVRTSNQFCITGIPDDEERRVDWVEAQLGQIGEMGLENYIQPQPSYGETRAPGLSSRAI